MKNVRFLIIGIMVVVFSSCAKVYHSPDARTRASNHQVIAIVPPQVSITAARRVNADALQEHQRTESLSLQKEMYAWLLRRKGQNKFLIDIQDVETTNAKLAKLGYFEGNQMTPAEIANSLGVDGVLTSQYLLSKPMTEGSAVALAIFFGVAATTNEATVSLTLHDNITEKMIWNYHHTVSGSLGSSPARLVNAVMRRATNKMPYKQ